MRHAAGKEGVSHPLQLGPQDGTCSSVLLDRKVQHDMQKSACMCALSHHRLHARSRLKLKCIVRPRTQGFGVRME